MLKFLWAGRKVKNKREMQNGLSLYICFDLFFVKGHLIEKSISTSVIFIFEISSFAGVSL